MAYIPPYTINKERIRTRVGFLCALAYIHTEFLSELKPKRGGGKATTSKGLM